MSEQASRGSYGPTRRRRERLIELLHEDEGEGNVRQLADLLGVSASTVRRDLAFLQADRRVARTYGGAIDPVRLERSWRVKSTENLRQKRAIAEHAAGQVAQGSTVLLDAGTTVAEVAALLGARQDVHLITNGLNSLMALADATAEVTVLGGRLRRPSESIVGSSTVQALERLAADLAFLGAEALSPDRGINCPELDQASTKELMAMNSRSAWVLADSSKLSRTPAFPYWSRVERTCRLVTDDGATEAQLRPYRDAGWLVEVVGARP